VVECVAKDLERTGRSMGYEDRKDRYESQSLRVRQGQCGTENTSSGVVGPNTRVDVVRSHKVRVRRGNMLFRSKAVNCIVKSEVRYLRVMILIMRIFGSLATMFDRELVFSLTLSSSEPKPLVAGWLIGPGGAMLHCRFGVDMRNFKIFWS
jgi:hypothetical protein